MYVRLYAKFHCSTLVFTAARLVFMLKNCRNFTYFKVRFQQKQTIFFFLRWKIFFSASQRLNPAKRKFLYSFCHILWKHLAETPPFVSAFAILSFLYGFVNVTEGIRHGYRFQEHLLFLYFSGQVLEESLVKVSQTK